MLSNKYIFLKDGILFNMVELKECLFCNLKLFYLLMFFFCLLCELGCLYLKLVVLLLFCICFNF